MRNFNPNTDICECGHPRSAHDADADYSEGRWVGYSLNCEHCQCEEFAHDESWMHPVDIAADRMRDRQEEAR